MLAAAITLLGLAGLAAAQPAASQNRVSFALFPGAGCTGASPTLISLGAGVCQADSPTGSHVAVCNGDGGGAVVFCTDAVCSKNCSERAFKNGVCAATSSMPQSNSAASFLATCSAAAAPPPSDAPKPLGAAPPPAASGGAVPSTLPNATAPVSSGAGAAARLAAAGAAVVIAVAATLA